MSDGTQIKVLMEAARRAAVHGSVLRGAPSHTGAHLLAVLEQMGWELRPVAEHPEDLGGLVEPDGFAQFDAALADPPEQGDMAEQARDFERAKAAGELIEADSMDEVIADLSEESSDGV